MSFAGNDHSTPPRDTAGNWFFGALLLVALTLFYFWFTGATVPNGIGR